MLEYLILLYFFLSVFIDKFYVLFSDSELLRYAYAELEESRGAIQVYKYHLWFIFQHFELLFDIPSVHLSWCSLLRKYTKAFWRMQSMPLLYRIYKYELFKFLVDIFWTILIKIIIMFDVQFIRFLRRNEGVEAARKYFIDARKSPNCTYHVYVAYAMMAFCLDKDAKVSLLLISNCWFRLHCRSTWVGSLTAEAKISSRNGTERTKSSWSFPVH